MMMISSENYSGKNGQLYTLHQEHVDMLHQNFLFQVVERLQMTGGVEQYRELVRKHQGKNVKIIETTEECQIIGLLRKALDDN